MDAAPEIRHNRMYNTAADIWALGVIIYVCLTGKFPFENDESLVDESNFQSFLSRLIVSYEISQNGNPLS